MSALEKTAAEKHRSYQECDSVSDVTALLELSAILNASQNLDFILSNVLLTAMGKLLITRAVVLVETTDWRYSVRTIKGFSSNALSEEFILPVDWKKFLTVESLTSTADSSIKAFIECCNSCKIKVLIPMIINDRMVGIIGLGGKSSKEKYKPAEITFLESIAAIGATAVQSALTIDALKNANRQLDSKIQEMNTLFELSREMNANFDEQKILRVLSYVLMGQLRIMRFIVCSFDGGTMQPVLVKVSEFQSKEDYYSGLVGITAPIVFSPARKPASEAEEWLHSMGILIIIPMLSRNETRGLLCLGDRMGISDYEPHEIEYLTALSNITISALENARLVKETIEKQRIEKELSLARNIQKGLLPEEIPQPAGYEIASANEPSQQVGGDYFDVIKLSEDEYALAIGDVSGKGIPASLLMANVQAALRTIIPLRLPLSEATARINSLVFDNTAADKFITFFWGILNARDHTFRYINAGHNPPLHLANDGSCMELSEGGMILGIMPDPPSYQTGVIKLERNDYIVMYTDGVSEAMSKDNEEFGEVRLVRLLANMVGSGAINLVETVISEIKTFAAEAGQYDDITMLVLKRCS